MSDSTANVSNGSPDSRRAGSWFGRHRWGLVWAAFLVVIVLVQWPMLKGVFYRVSGSTAPDDGIAWRTDFDAALAESRQSGKPVLLDFSASWCPPCQVMKHDVWPDARVREAVTAGYIPVLLDVDAAGNKVIVARYGVRAIPSIVIVDGDGKVLKEGSFMSSSSLLDFLARQAS